MKIVFILSAIAFIFYFILRDNLVKTTGSNNKTYYTRKNQADIAVEELVKIDDFLLRLNKLLVEEHPDHILIQKKLKKPITLKELPDNSKHIAYTINKNNMYICLRDNSGEFENQYNRVYFVVMHELAHIITKSVGHTEEYWDNYRLVLKTAIDNGLYEYKNYYEEPVEFCNKKINSTPYVKGGEINSDENWNIIMFGLILIIGFFIYKKFFKHSTDSRNLDEFISVNKLTKEFSPIMLPVYCENNECRPHNIWGDRVFKMPDGNYYG
jgi:hypothetical protein